MSPQTELERLAVVEAKLEALQAQVSGLDGKLDHISSIIDKAGGAKWVIGAGIFIVSAVTTIIYYMSGILHPH